MLHNSNAVDYAQYLDDIAYLAAADVKDRAKLLRQLVSDGSDNTGVGNSSGRSKERLEALTKRFSDWSAEKVRKLQALRDNEKARAEEAERSACTFTPRISPRARRYLRLNDVSESNGSSCGLNHSEAAIDSTHQSSFDMFVAQEERWAKERVRKREEARRIAEETQKMNEEALLRDQRDGSRWVSPSSRRMLLARQKRLANNETVDGSHSGGQAGPSSSRRLPRRHTTHAQNSARENGKGHIYFSCQAGPQEGRAAFMPVISPRSRALAKDRPSIFQTASTATTATEMEKKVVEESLTPDMLDWLRGKKLSREAEKDLIDRLYGRSGLSNSGEALDAEGVVRRPLAVEEKIKMHAKLFKGSMQLLKKQQGREKKREELERSEFYTATPFAPRIEPFICDRDWKGQRISVPSHLAADWARRRYRQHETRPADENTNADAGRGGRWATTPSPRRKQVSREDQSPFRARRASEVLGRFLDRQAMYEDRKEWRRATNAAVRQESEKERVRDECPFRPTLSPRSRVIAARLFRDMSATEQSTANETSMEKGVSHNEEDPSPSPAPKPHPESRAQPQAALSYSSLTVSPLFSQRGRLMSRNQLRIENGESPRDPLHYTDFRNLRLVLSPRASAQSTAKKTEATPDCSSSRRERSKWPTCHRANRLAISEPPCDSPEEPDSASRDDSGGALLLHHTPGAFSAPYMVSRPAMWSRTTSPLMERTVQERQDDSDSGGGDEVEDKAAEAKQAALTPLAAPRLDFPKVTFTDSAAPPQVSPPPQPSESPPTASALPLGLEARRGTTQAAAAATTAAVQLRAGDGVTVSEPLVADSHTLLSLSHWWAALVDAHLLTGNGRLAPLADGDVDADADADDPGEMLPPAAEDGNDPSGLWLREAVLGACSPFELPLPLSLITRALSLLLRDPQVDGGEVATGHAAADMPPLHDADGKRKLVVAEEERSLRCARREGGFDRSNPGAPAAMPFTSCRLYLLEKGRSVTTQRCPVVLYNNEVLFREFISLYEWLFPLL